MITITHEAGYISVSVAGQFTLSDYREFEENAIYSMKFGGKIRLLMDLRDMLDFTIDVAWEELKFTREHPNDFERIAVITSDQWLSWSAWLSRLYMDAQIASFDDPETAQKWLLQN